MGHCRRGFLKFILGAGAGITLSPVPWKLIDDVSIWSQNWSWIPSIPRGTTSYVNTTSKLSPAHEGLRIRFVDAQPNRSLSDHSHPLGGGTSALSAAEVQLLYSPVRVRQPLKRAADGVFVPATWAEAEAMLLKAVQGAGSSLALVSGDETGASVDVLSAFASAAGSEDFYLMPSEAQSASRAWSLMGGRGQVAYDLENSDCVLAVGANILESWGTFVRNRRIFAEKHPHGEEPKMTLFYAGPVQNNTAAVASAWLPIRPGTESVFALGLANLLIQNGREFDSPDFADFKGLAADWTPDKVAEVTGLPAEQLDQVAGKLLSASTPLVLCGSEINQGGGAAPVMAGFALNLLLGALRRKGGIRSVPMHLTQTRGAQERSVVFERDLPAFLSEGSPKALLFYEANPVYALPKPDDVKDCISKAAFKASFTSFMDETAMLCDLVLPMPMGLERWDDIETPYGSGKVFFALSRPVTPAPEECRHGLDVLLALADKLGYGLPARYEEVLQAKAVTFNAPWADLKEGKTFEFDQELPYYSGLKLRPDVLAAAVDQVGSHGEALGDGALRLAPMLKVAMGTPSTGIPPFNVKTIRGNELTGREMHVFMNRGTASRLSLKEGCRVELAPVGGGDAVTALVSFFEGIVPECVGVYAGFGHTALDEFSQNKGANLAGLFTPAREPETGLSVWSQCGVSIKKA